MTPLPSARSVSHSDDEALLGGLLAKGRIPPDLRRLLRPELVLPERRALLQALLSADEPFNWQAILRLVYGEDAPSQETRLTLAAAFEDQLPLYLRLLEMRAQIGGKAAAEPEAIAPEALAAVLDRLEPDLRAGIVPKAIPTGFPGLTKMLDGGFCPGELAFIAASAGTGKTAFALELARAAAKAGENVLVVSREMKSLALARRLLGQEARVAVSRIKRANLGAGEWVLLETALERLRSLPIWLTDAAVTLPQIRSAIETGAFGLLIVDYLQLVRVPGAESEKRHQVEAAAQGLKEIAMGAGIPVVLLSSIARLPGGPDSEPTKQSLRESGELEHVGDLIILLHRKFEARECACIVAKNRDGWEGRVQLLFRKEWTAFEECETRGEE